MDERDAQEAAETFALYTRACLATCDPLKIGDEASYLEFDERDMERMLKSGDTADYIAWRRDIRTATLWRLYERPERFAKELAALRTLWPKEAEAAEIEKAARATESVDDRWDRIDAYARELDDTLLDVMQRRLDALQVVIDHHEAKQAAP